MTQTGIKHFYKKNVNELPQMILGQGHDTLVGYKHSLCEKKHNEQHIFTSPVMNLDLTQITLVQGHDTPTDHKQSLCENFQCLSFKKIWTKHVLFCIQRYKPDIHFALFLPETLTLPK